MVNVAWSPIGQIFGQLLLPSSCILCGKAIRSVPVAQRIDLCGDCAADLPTNTSACTRCAEPLPASTPANSICGQCLRKPPKYHTGFCAYRYEYPIDHIVRALKFSGRLAYGRVLGELLVSALQKTHCEPWPQLVIPIPLADARFRERGFNQAIELGRVIEQRLAIPLRADLAVRTRATSEQTGLDRKARRKNVRNAFALKERLPAKHVAILDDVITTGSTVNEFARVLRRAGAKRVEVWAVARTRIR